MTELLTHRMHVLAVAMAIVRDRSLAEDVVQDTFVIAFAKRSQLRDESAVAGWLAAIARNRARDVMRARRRERARSEDDVDDVASTDDPEAALADVTRAAHVRRTLAKMPARYRDVLLAFYGDGHSAKAIAEKLGITEAATLQRLSRGRKMVAERDGHLRDLAILVIALFAARRAEAATSKPRRVWLAAASMMVLASWSDLRAERESSDVSPALPLSSSTAQPSSASSVPPVLVTPVPPVCSAPPATTPTAPKPVRAPVSTRPPTVVLQAPPAPVVPAPSSPLADVTFEAEPIAAAPSAPTGVANVWYAADAFLDNAAMPAPGSYSIEMQGLQFVAHRGITDHLAIHVGFTAMDMRSSAMSMSTTPVGLVGVGIKTGATLRDNVRVSAIVEGSREWHSGTLDLGDRGIVRAYASLTLGTARSNLTLSGGVLAVSERQDSITMIPMYAIGLQAGFADHAALVVEEQAFTAPLVDFTSSTVVAFRGHGERGDMRMRVDLGTMLVRDGDRSTFFPWLQVGVGW